MRYIESRCKLCYFDALMSGLDGQQLKMIEITTEDETTKVSNVVDDPLMKTRLLLVTVIFL